MAQSNQISNASRARPRKATSKGPLIVKLKAPQDFLRKLAPSAVDAKPPSSSPPDNTITSASSSATELKVENGTPIPAVLSTAGAMLPPTETVKKKAASRGTKRGANALGESTPKPRGKPGPKKKPRLEDGTIDHTSTPPTTTGRTTTGSHKLGPKANQGAINAGLRALDRSGKPCRKWQRGSFKLKSFTGVQWEIPRWRAPPKTIVLPETESQSTSATSGDGSGKENLTVKEELASSVVMAQSDKSTGNSAGEPGSLVSSPAPVSA